jgi:hypothetical protein
MERIKSYQIFCSENEISESMNYHLQNSVSLFESVFRVGSEAHIALITEARGLYEKGVLKLPATELYLFEESDLGKWGEYEGKRVCLDLPLPLEEYYSLDEAEYRGKNVTLNKPKRGGTKKFYVYVKNPKTGKVVKVQFGDTTGKKVKINDPEARRSFSARHKCHMKKDRTKPGYWACRMTKFPWLNSGNKTYPGFW